MKIKEITYRNRRDFKAVYECEKCGHTHEDWGYDDRNFHENVIPTFECKQCGESAKSLNSDYRPLTTKYPEGYQV